jgi:hypothetical protein
MYFTITPAKESRRARNRRLCCRCDALPFPHRRGSTYDMGRIVARCPPLEKK